MEINNRVKADAYFLRPPEKLNCAQSILKSFQSIFNISEEEIASFNNLGGGDAEDGICGALFAAKYLLKEHKEELENEFKEELGNITCKELKKEKKNCFKCVSCADKLVESFLRNE